MCGLVGVLTQGRNGPWRDEWDAFNQLMVVNNLRGAHSTGVGAIMNDGDVGYRKTVGTVWDLWNCKNWDEYAKSIFSKGRFVMGHGRSATRGTINDDNAHPFLVDEGKDRQLLLVHNGTLDASQKLPDFSKYPVDSLWMCHMIAQKGVREVFEKINGAIATMWYDSSTKEVNFYRNYQRPLFRAKLPNGSYLFNSELESLVWINARLKLNIKPEDVTDLSPYTLYTVNLDTLEWKEEKIEKKYETTTTFGYGREAWANGWVGDYENFDDRAASTQRQSGPNTTTTNRRSRMPLLKIVHDDYKDLRANMRLRQIYLDVFSGKASEAVFDSRGAVVEYKDQRYPVQSTFPHIMAPKFAVTRIKHVSENKLDEESVLAGQGTFVARLNWDDIFEEVVPLNKDHKESSKADEDKEARRPFIGRKFRPDKKIRFNVAVKASGKGKDIQIKNFGLTMPSNKYNFNIYGNEVDGVFYHKGTIAFEPFEATEVSTFNGGNPIFKVLGSLLSAKSNSLVTVEWFTSEFKTREDIFAAGVFIGEIECIALSTKLEHKQYREAVRIIAARCVILDKITPELSKRHAVDTKYTFDDLLKKSEILMDEVIEGSEE